MARTEDDSAGDEVMVLAESNARAADREREPTSDTKEVNAQDKQGMRARGSSEQSKRSKEET